jgi:protein-tyrosine phosphatase
VLDLRTPEELTERGRYPVGDHWVTFHHLPIIDVTWDPTAVSDDEESVAEFLLARYLEMLEMGEPRLAEAFQLLAMPEALPAVFHCAAGKDRTGLLAALLLSALGVSDEVVVADYALTGEAMERMRAWLEVHNPEWLAMMNAQPAAFLAADPAAMAGVLELIRQAHGSTRAYLSTLGVSSVALAALEDSFLEAG